MLSEWSADHAWPGTIPAFVEAYARGRYVMPDLARHSLARTIQTLLFSWRGGRLNMSGGRSGRTARTRYRRGPAKVGISRQGLGDSRATPQPALRQWFSKIVRSLFCMNVDS